MSRRSRVGAAGGVMLREKKPSTSVKAVITFAWL
jgi:hypothetical protein